MKIIVTNIKSPTFIGTLYSIREYFDCDIIGIISKDTGNALLTDKNYRIEPNLSPNEYLKQILNICKLENANMIIPHNNKDRLLFMANKKLFDEIDTKILSSNSKSIIDAESKSDFLDLCKLNNIPYPEYYTATSYSELREYANKLGYPQKKVIVKPVQSSGSRGLRILNKKVNFKKLFSQHRPDFPETTISNLRHIIGDKFQPLLVSEYLPGKEYTIDGFRQNGNEEYIVRERVVVKNGLTDVGKIVNHPELVKYSKLLAEKLNLETVFGFQFKDDEYGNPKILECNPRIQGTMHMSTVAGANIIAASIADFLKLEEVKLDIDFGMTFYRLNSGIGIGRDIKIINYKKTNKDF